MKLGWNANPPEDNVLGYVVQYGTAAGVYTWHRDVGDVSSYAVTGLDIGTRYYFSIEAYGAGGYSGDSTEVSGLPTTSTGGPLVSAIYRRSASIQFIGSNPTTSGNIDTTDCNLFVWVISYLNGITLTVADSASNTWQTRVAVQATANVETEIRYCIAPTTSATHNFTLTGSGYPYAAATIMCFGLAATVSPFDQVNSLGSGGSASSQQTGSVTPLFDGEIIAAVLGQGHGGGNGLTASIDSGFTIANQIADGGNLGHCAAYLIQGTAAAVNPTFTLDGSADWIGASIATFKGQVASALSVTQTFHRPFPFLPGSPNISRF